ncbi:MAG: hypothetical protein U5R31_02935, partial [Acidimicrobiia bacterium]|nr:hypothetical protein [Acidimicrobiia bacterium]
MTAVLDNLTKVEPKRDRYGRPLVKLPGASDRQPLTRVTTIAETLGDRFALEQWSKRNVILGIAARRDLYAHAASLTAEDSDDLNDIAKAAEEAAGASTGATTGTALHRFTERVDAGETVEIPAPWDADIAAYQAALAAHGIEIVPEMLERFVVNAAMGAAGTADRFVRWQARPGRLVVADLKTGKTIDLAKISIQLALYARAETTYDPATDTHEPLDGVDHQVGLVIHLPAGKATCTIYEVDLAEGWCWAQVAVDVRGWRKSKPGRELTIPTLAETPQAAADDGLSYLLRDVERDTWLRARIAYLRDHHPDAFAKLAEAWPAAIPTLRSEHAHSTAELAQIAAVVGQVETSARVPFPDDPLPPSKTELVGRLKALPADLLAAVEGEANEAGIPNLAGRAASTAHLEAVAEMCDRAEAQHQARRAANGEALNAACDRDPEISGAIIRTAAGDTP